MQIVEPKVELIVSEDAIEHVAKCARICYASESKGRESDRKLYQALKDRKHMSVFRHETHYYIIPREQDNEFYYRKCHWFNKSPYVEIYDDGGYYDIYMVANGQWVKDNSNLTQWLIQFETDADEFNDTQFGHEMMRYTFCLTTQISTSRELNRVSPNNITEMSTRYIKFGGKVTPSIVKPWWIADVDIRDWESGEAVNDYKTEVYLNGCEKGFEFYNALIENGMKPQDARGVLPLDTMTKVIYTYSIKEWRNIINLRYFGTTGAPHGNAKLIIGLVKDELEKLGYTFNAE